MESVKLSVQTNHKFLMQVSIFCRCITNVKTLSGCVIHRDAPGARKWSDSKSGAVARQRPGKSGSKLKFLSLCTWSLERLAISSEN